MKKQPLIIKLRLVPDENGNTAPPPTYATPGAAAVDLCAFIPTSLLLPPGRRVLVPTGLSIELPGPGFSALVFARSGLAVRHGIALSNGVGVIDSDYRGEIRVGLINHSDTPYTILPGDRIAQMAVFCPCPVSFSLEAALSESEREGGGFGSTGR